MDANPFDAIGFDDGPAQQGPGPKNGSYQVSLGLPAAPPNGNPFDKFGYDDGNPNAAPTASAPVDTTPKRSVAADIGLSAGTGVIRGTAAQVGLPGSVQDSWNTVWDRAALGAAHKVMDWTGYGPQAGTPDRADFDKAYNATSPDSGIVADVTAKAGIPNPTSLPTGKDVTGAIEKVVGPLPTPQTRAGQYAETIGEFLPAVTAGPDGPTILGTATRKTAETVLPAVASETAAQMTKGSPYEPYSDVARLGAAAATGVGMSGLASKFQSYRAPMDKLGGFQRPIGLDGDAGAIARDAAGQPITATKNQAALAGGFLESRATDPVAVRASLSNGTQEIVPGSTPTTFQQTGDMGLGQLERSVSSANADRFLQRGADQNAARVGQINSLAADASPADVANHFRSMRDAMDADHQSAAAASQQTVDDAGRAIGGNGSTPETVGAGLREPIAQARAAAKTNENNLWDAVDPTGKMVMPAAPISSAAKSITAAVTPSATPMAGEEARIFDVASRYGDQMPFSEVKDLRSSISTAMRAAQQSGDAQSMRRLTLLRGAVENSIDHGVENQAALDQIAVQRGTMAPEDAMEARMRSAWGVQVDGRAANASTSLARTGTSPVGFADGGAADSAGGVRAGRSTAGGIGQASSDSGIPSPPPLDADAAARLKAASAATKNRANTFDEGVVGKALEQGSSAASFQRSDAQMGRLFFHPGPTGGEDLRSYLAAGGSQEAATEAAAASLRSAALRRDGTFDGPAIHAWMKQHDSAINELPPQVRDRFQHSIDAQDAYDEIVANQRQRENELRRSAAGPLLNLYDPSSITRHVGSVFGQKNAADVMGFLASRAAADPAARDGLRRAIVDHIQGRFLGGEAGTSGTPQIKGQSFINFFRANQPALGKVFTPEETGKISAITQDLERAQRSIQATQLKGRSNTLQDYLLTKPHAPDKSILSNMAVQAMLALGGHYLAGPVGAMAGWFGSKPVGAMRNAGITRIDHLVTEAMLNPDLAKALLAKAPTVKDGGTAATLGLRLRQIAAAQSAPLKSGNAGDARNEQQ